MEYKAVNDTNINKLQLGSVVYLNAKIVDNQPPVMLLVKIMALHNKNKGLVEIKPLASDNSCVWVNIQYLYFTN